MSCGIGKLQRHTSTICYGHQTLTVSKGAGAARLASKIQGFGTTVFVLCSLITLLWYCSTLRVSPI